jgi:hypothetical protein
MAYSFEGQYVFRNPRDFPLFHSVTSIQTLIMKNTLRDAALLPQLVCTPRGGPRAALPPPPVLQPFDTMGDPCAALPPRRVLHPSGIMGGPRTALTALPPRPALQRDHKPVRLLSDCPNQERGWPFSFLDKKV